MDVGNENFDQEVLEASKREPVVVDFWAPWCGPCRTLTPIIEKVADELAGRVKLVKVNSDENPELSQAFGIRSIPTVIAFKDGRPAAHFLGALPEAQVRAFMEKLLPSPAEAVLAHAEALLEENRVDEAERALGDPALAPAAHDPALAARIAALEHGIAFARAGANGPSEEALRARLAADPADHDARLALAGRYAAERNYAQAMEELLEIVRRAKDWRDGEARKQLLALFNLAASDPDLVAAYRRKLASALH